MRNYHYFAQKANLIFTKGKRTKIELVARPDPLQRQDVQGATHGRTDFEETEETPGRTHFSAVEVGAVAPTIAAAKKQTFS